MFYLAPPKSLPRLLAPLWCCLLGASASTAQLADPADVQYNRDIRPILAENCFRCHGPDAATRQADLRLDRGEEAIAQRGGSPVIVPGQPEASELIRRITTTDDDQRMPPAGSGSHLRDAEIDLIRNWIAAGARYQAHWSFIPPSRPALPEVARRHWPNNAVDHFVLAKLERERIGPSRQADASTLIRRLTLDLTGLPPTLAEVDAFERASKDNPQLAYRRLVDRLLASPRFGQRIALGWLDAARYADTNGYFTDLDRTMWPWRDWVVDALNRNMPLDQFTIHQLAGDLLPDSTIEQKIATGFNRNHMVNNETGIIEEEFRVEYVVDRVDTTATVWMGLTIGCARCHDHKYDPISQKDFYRFFALFNNVPEKGLSGSLGNAAPLLEVPSRDQQAELKRLRRAIADAEKEFAAIAARLDEDQAAWETTLAQDQGGEELDGLSAHFPLDKPSSQQIGTVEFVPGMLGSAAKFGGDACIAITDTPPFQRDRPFSLGAWIRPEGAGCVISKIDDADDMRGLDVVLRKGKAVVNLVHRWNRDAIGVSTVTSIANQQWQHLMVTYDGSAQASGVKIYFDGMPQPTSISQDNLRGTIENEEPLRIGRRQASGSYSGHIDDVRLYDRALAGEEIDRLATSQFLCGVVAQPPEKRSSDQTRKLRAWFIQHRADEDAVAASNRLEQLRENQRRVAASVPTTMVMQEAKEPRQAFVLARGQYDQPGEEVDAGVPEFFSAAPISNRHDLALWLVDRSHPLTARVMVNRLWQRLLGSGIVKTVDDFGTQGDWPSHPQLLDYLAVELVESGWDLKHLLREIVCSKTYRQSSRCSPELLELDRENRLLARGPRFRMDAETLRDNALAISGLLVETQGGPPVKPYQPAGLWEDVTYDSDRAYQSDAGNSLYRRSLYTFWKRQAPPPSMLVFDAPTRDTCTVERSRTNTPLQALVLMNDPTFVEAARNLAQRMIRERLDTNSQRAAFVFRTATARRPTAAETDILLRAYQRQVEHFESNRDGALALLSVGESNHDPSLDSADLAAWTTIASMILSLDETITK